MHGLKDTLLLCNNPTPEENAEIREIPGAAAP
jgi:hypothetical protein